MTDRLTMLAVSPHLDDAALSIGGLLASQQAASVVTVFAGQPPKDTLSRIAVELHESCGHGWDSITHRRREDFAACSCLGVGLRQLGHLDALYRRLPSGEPLIVRESDLFAQRVLGPGETTLQRVEQDLDAELQFSRPQIVLCPLAIGGHVDHCLVRAAMERLYWRGRLLGAALWFYEDLPYASRVTETVGSELRARTSCVVRHILAPHWDTKIAALREYPSQIRMLWPDSNRMEVELETYAMLVGEGKRAERLWRFLRAESDHDS